MRRLNHSILTVLAVCGVHAPSAFADITLQQNVTVSASGMMSMMGSKGTMTTTVSGERARTENHMESTSNLMRKFAKNMNTATIVRLDEELMLNLAPEKQEYSEITFAEMRAQMDKSMQQLEQGSEQDSLPVSEEECQWTPPEMEVKKTGEKQRFAGIKAEQTLITVTQTCHVPNSGKSCEMIWNLEYWNADKMPGGDEAMAFQKGMARAMGGDEALGVAQTYTRGLMAMFKQGWDDVLKEGGKMEGFPVKTVMSLAMGGENCTTDSGQPIALDDAWGKDAAISSASGQAGDGIGNAAANSMGNNTGGAIAGSAIGAASREIMSGMFNKLGKKKDQPEAVAETAVSASDTVTIFEITSELTGVDNSNVSESVFVVPTGWKKVANNW